MHVIDIGTHHGVRPATDQDLRAETLLRIMAHNGVRAALTWSLKAAQYDFAGNDETLALCRTHPNLYPVAVVDPRRAPDCYAEVERCAVAGCVAFRFPRELQGWPIANQAFQHLLRAVERTRLPVIVHVPAAGDATALLHLVGDIEIPIVLSAVSYATLSEALSVLADAPHFSLEACRVALPGQVEVMVEQVGAERIMFGSWAPTLAQRPSLDAILCAEIDEQDKARILSSNARRLFGLPPIGSQAVETYAVPPGRAAPYPVVDVHQHNGPWPFPGRWGGIELNLRLMERCGIDAAIVSSGEAIVDDMVGGNARLARAIADHPNLYGYVVVNPRQPTLSARELERYANVPRFVGAKVHTSYSATPMGEPRMADLFAVLARWGRPVLIHTWGVGEVRALRELARRHPDLSIVVAHAGGDAWREAIEAARAAPNLYLDFCISSPERGRIERAVAALGPERVLFGTDSTLLDPRYMRSCFEEAEIAPEHRPLIMGGNAIRLFGLPLGE